MLCLLALTLGLTGPLTRGLSAQAKALPLAVTVETGTSATAGMSAGAVSAKRCQRGAIVWFNCSFEPRHVASDAQLEMADTFKTFGIPDGQSAEFLRASDIFKPPRSR